MANPWDFSTPIWYEHSVTYPTFWPDDSESGYPPPFPPNPGDYASAGCVNIYGIINTNIDHLEGQTVSILADGNVASEVVTSGAVTTTGSEIHVGLPFTSEFETVNIEVPMADGTLQGRAVKVSNVSFRLLNTRGGYIDPNKNTIYEAFTEENLDKATPITENPAGDPAIYNVDVRVPLGAGYTGGGRIYYKQTDPLPVTISAVIPEVTIG